MYVLRILLWLAKTGPLCFESTPILQQIWQQKACFEHKLETGSKPKKKKGKKQEEVDEGIMNVSGERDIDDNHLTRSLWIYTTANIVGVIILLLVFIPSIIF